ncbi:phosphoglucosamine mutase [Rickettsiales bacterium]|nr:phosphoglucosamine mutase [Rickettsiales bacterium]MDB2550592.1 phosphoglucosamine mutase [Rickettsiales bacterium]
MRKYFGTDGIRGAANKFPMTADMALRVGMAVGAKLKDGTHKHRIIIGKDTRLSGYMIESALAAGMIAVGMDVFLVGPVPTPAIPMLIKSLRADIGIMISASHNPYHDNGIKIFSRNGSKLDDKTEKEIEEMIDGDLNQYLSAPDQIGTASRIKEAKDRYMEFVKNTLPKNLSLEGLKVVVDAANGAAYDIASRIFWELGADVIAIGNQPNGSNINQDCGSTKPKLLQDKVLEEKADIGIALDGDADRVVICDEKGQIIDGDKLIALIANKLHIEGKLKKDIVVVTHMSNMALEQYLRYHGINMVRAGIGDRYVMEKMKKLKCNFGGEQSGHIILSDHSTTGDGLVSALQIVSLMTSDDRKLSEIANIFELSPQILKNVKFNGTNPLEKQEIQDLITKEAEDLGQKGRILVRKSGTEDLIRIMIEGENANQINEVANRIANLI